MVHPRDHTGANNLNNEPLENYRARRKKGITFVSHKSLKERKLNVAPLLKLKDRLATKSFRWRWSADFAQK